MKTEISDHEREQRRRIRNSVNSLRHGLTTVRRTNPIFAAEIVDIAKSMSDESDGVVYDKALLVAECDVTIAEIRKYKHYLILRMKDPNSLSTTQKKLQFRMGRAKVRRMIGIAKPPRNRSDFHYGDFACLMTENWGSPGGIELSIIRALPDLLKITGYETRIWRMRRRRFLEFLHAMEGAT